LGTTDLSAFGVGLDEKPGAAFRRFRFPFPDKLRIFGFCFFSGTVFL
jgi:hypothetical protein